MEGSTLAHGENDLPEKRPQKIPDQKPKKHSKAQRDDSWRSEPRPVRLRKNEVAEEE